MATARARSGCWTILFDLDGLLVDSEALYAAAYARAAAQQGFELGEACFATLIGRSNDEAEQLVAARFGASLDRDLFAASWRAHFEELFPSLEAKPGARELLELCEQLGLPRAVASSSEREVVQRSLAITDLARHFAVLACGDEVARAKPAPDVFLLAAARLDVAPASCLVLEDSRAGLLAARAAGMSAILVPDRVPAPHATGVPVCRDLFAVRPWILAAQAHGFGGGLR